MHMYIAIEQTFAPHRISKGSVKDYIVSVACSFYCR